MRQKISRGQAELSKAAACRSWDFYSCTARAGQTVVGICDLQVTARSREVQSGGTRPLAAPLLMAEGKGGCKTRGAA